MTKPIIALYDRTGREIVAGDVVKVFHFTGARRKRHYMYKQAVALRALPKSGLSVMDFSHLNMAEETYHEWADGRRLDGYEIVQSIDCLFEDRPRISETANTRAIDSRGEV